MIALLISLFVFSVPAYMFIEMFGSGIKRIAKHIYRYYIKRDRIYRMVSR